MSHADAAVTLIETLETAVAAGATGVELAAAALEEHLGAPTPIVPLEPPPANGLELGLLELEEEVLLDEYRLARRTFLETLQTWRTSVDLAPLVAVRRIFEAAGISIAAVRWDGLAELSDPEIDYAMRATAAVGAAVLTTDGTPETLPRLGPAAARHGIELRAVTPTP